MNSLDKTNSGPNAAAIAAGFLLAACLAMPASAQMLISEQEAALPAAPGGAMAFRGVTRGPKVQLVSPAAEGGTVKSPVNLRLKFESFGGAVVDPAAVKVTYLKSPAVDLTPRLKASIKPSGIEMPTAEMPAGDHSIRVEIKDSEGRSGSTNFTLKITK
ncbi:MAG: hypothetical protein FJX47_06175 [Alphaproteobacteria bacterium]|nr:hypothetical protein [Alphaproteobacteria bacterium]